MDYRASFKTPLPESGGVSLTVGIIDIRVDNMLMCVYNMRPDELKMARNLKAIIEWTEDGSLIKTTQTFDLPYRTSVELAFPVPLVPKAPGVIEETTAYISAYRCIDCDFETQSFEIMEEHQKSGEHSLGRRIKRFLGI